MKKGIVLSADIGGSHITAALIDMEHRNIIPGSVYRSHVDSHADAVTIINGWCNTMQQSMRTAANVHRIGMAMPGPFDYEKGISLITGLHKYEALYGMNIKDLLSERLAIDSSNINIANDAACFLQGELFNGAAKGQKEAAGLTLGTGFGSALADNGLALEGSFWQTPFRDATAEEYFSTRWFLRRYEELSGQKIASVKELAAIVHTSDHAAAIFREFGYNLAMFLLQQQPLPSLIVLGGNITRSFDLFSANLHQHLPATRFVVSAMGEEAILLGAAGYWAMVNGQ